MYVSVQYLRAIAAISVVLFHLSSHAGAGENYGVLACGVDLFFIISGFIIYKSSVHENSASRFLLKRIIRIYPLWLCGLLIYIFMTHFVDGAQYDAQQILTSLTLIFHFNAVQGFVAPIYKIGWTPSLEMLFYLSWAAMVFLLPSENSIAAKRRPIAITFAFIVMIVAVKALLRLTSIMSLESPLSRLGDVHILEFCMGAMFAAFEQEMLRSFGRFRLWIAGGERALSHRRDSIGIPKSAGG